MWSNKEEIELKSGDTDILQLSSDTDSLILNGYHNNLKMSESADNLQLTQPVYELSELHISSKRKGQTVRFDRI